MSKHRCSECGAKKPSGVAYCRGWFKLKFGEYDFVQRFCSPRCLHRSTANMVYGEGLMWERTRQERGDR